MAGLSIAEAPARWFGLEKFETRELRYPAGSVVVLAGIPGAGKSTLIRRLFPQAEQGEYGVQVFDSGHIRDRWAPRLARLPYSWWRPLVHLTYYARVLRAMRRGGPLLVHDCATRPWVRQLIGWQARRSGLAVHLVLLDVPGDVARVGQQVRGRVVRSHSMDTHCRRWPRLLAEAAVDPGRIVPGAASAVVLTRGQADRLQRITFKPAAAA
ncbi:AAA domain-containing protein [Kribbella antiqua]|uniref:AAA domain-containing protein n=1 Tax=Kribbella antiqua TaxID=2512217 RepID=A0A4R2IJP9_9ACTN|nr:AAA family ATPase [Kribbella antiqua]TCO44857.1 AAA domain-containing protein [Kribbella antiqua]